MRTVAAAKPFDANAYARDASRRRILLAQDIASLYEDHRDQKEYEACRSDLERYLRTVYPRAFCRPFSADHKRAIAKTQEAATGGGLFCLAMPRGTGKTTIFERSMIWALSYRWRRFGFLVAAKDKAAQKSLKKIKTELSWNEIFQRQYPEIAYPLKCLGGAASKCRGQRWNGEETLVEYGADRIVFADVPPAVERGVAGSVLAIAGITASFKGMAHTLRSGEIIRPDFVLADDPQTRETAKSIVQTQQLEEIIMGDLLGMAGNDKTIAALIAITTICEDDLACRMLDREKHPDWQGITTKMVYSFPTNTAEWDKYWDLRSTALKNDGDTKISDKFYKKNRKKMDEGAVVAWPENIPDGKISVIQHAMDLRFRSYSAFMAEYQNDPVSLNNTETKMLPAAEIAAKVNGYGLGIVPNEATVLTAFIDVHDDLLYWIVTAWADYFSGWVIDYGTSPQQNRRYFSLADCRPTAKQFLGAKYPELRGQAKEPIIAKNLDDTLKMLTDKRWKKRDGTHISLTQGMVDEGYVKAIVHGAIARLGLSPATLPLWMPAKGKGITSTRKPFAEYQKHPGDIVGHHWRAPKPSPGELRSINIDTNYYKSFVHMRLFVPLEGRGCLSLYGTPKTDHTLISEHWTGELPKEVTSKTDNRTVTEWQILPNRDVHWLDCISGCAVGASMRGCVVAGTEQVKVKKGRAAAQADFMTNLKARGIV